MSELTKTREEMDLLNRASQTLDKTTSGLIRNMANLTGTQNKLWTVFSRLTSGTGLWAVQNLVRGVGGAVDEYFKAAANAERKTNEYYDGLSELSEVLQEVKKAKEDIKETDEFEKMKQTLKLIYEETEAHEMAAVMVQKRYDSQYEALKKSAEKEAKYLKKAMAKKERLEIKANKKSMIAKVKALDEERKKEIANAEMAKEMYEELLEKRNKLDLRTKEGRAVKKQLQDAEGMAKFQAISAEALEETYKMQKKALEESLGKIGLKGFITRQKEWVNSIDWKGGLGKVFAFSKKLLIYTLPLIMVIFLIFEIIKNIAKTGDLMGTVMTAVKEIMGGVFTALEGVMMIFQAFFGGGTFGERLGTLLKGFGKIFGGLGTILWTVLKGVVKLALGLLVGIILTYMKIVIKFVTLLFNWKTVAKKVKTAFTEWVQKTFPDGLSGFVQGIWDGFVAQLDKIGRWFAGLVQNALGDIFPFASGGIVTNSGLQLVGERGPELVKLPMGSRVHSNKDSRSMLASSNNTTINVSVNGRVGASDTELRDIAKKVGRMVSAEINRSTSSSTNVRY